MSPNFKAILLKLLIWTPITVSQYYIRTIYDYSNEDLKIFLAVCFVIFNICVFRSALSIRCGSISNTHGLITLNFSHFTSLYFSSLLASFCLWLHGFRLPSSGNVWTFRGSSKYILFPSLFNQQAFVSTWEKTFGNFRFYEMRSTVQISEVCFKIYSHKRALVL